MHFVMDWGVEQRRMVYENGSFGIENLVILDFGTDRDKTWIDQQDDEWLEHTSQVVEEMWEVANRLMRCGAQEEDILAECLSSSSSSSELLGGRLVNESSSRTFEPHSIVHSSRLLVAKWRDLPHFISESISSAGSKVQFDKVADLFASM